MIDIYKASAGSGKTYTLSKTYLDLLLKAESNTAYRNILAVTFTNKATEEMKERILKDLFKAGENDSRARNILITLLHDYSAFSVSTIDKFFQQALRAFAREIGHSGNYQIELDKTSLVNEAMDRVLDDLKENDTQLLSWFTTQINNSLDNGESLDIENGLYKMGKEFSDVAEKISYDKEKLSEIKKDCKEIIESFHKGVFLAASSIDSRDWGKRDSKTLSKYLTKRKYNDDMPAACDTLLKKLQDVDNLLFSLLNPNGTEWRKYKTAKVIEKNIFTLGLADEFYSKLQKIEEEKGVISLDESTYLLKEIIDGSDAPFIYEKLGVRYNHFLLDEFQDTSVVQWENFKPLLENSVSEGFKDIIVGDVKQSIYRWRNSDWHLLESQIENDFPGNTKDTSMQDNWRSTKNIVNFNNKFFTFAAQWLNQTDIYKDVCQNVRVEDSQDGYVTVDFCNDKEELDFVIKYIESAIENGAKLSDIGILVRKKTEGSAVAEALLSNGYSVISDDSLSLKSSQIIRTLISILHCIDTPNDALQTYIARKFTDIQSVTSTPYHSLLDLVDNLILLMKKNVPQDFEGQTLFIQSFMDELMDWSHIYGNDLHQFLKHIEDNDITISSPNDPNAIRIMTVHKSKGLAFPIVIFPFAEKVGLYKEDIHWCKLDSDAEMGENFSGFFPVGLSKTKVCDSFFSSSLKKEMELQVIDNLNLFYVCLTRAQKELHIIAKNPPQSFLNNSEAKDMSQILYSYCLKDGFNFGEPYMWDKYKNEEKPESDEFEANYQTFGMNPESCPKRFVASSDAWDYFSLDGVGKSKRLSGIEQHDLLSRIISTENIDQILKGVEPEIQNLLTERILSKPQWFNSSLKVINETSVIDPSGFVHRPDRVVIDLDGKVSIIDFKFGEESDEHKRQVDRYTKLYHDMGYGQVRGYVWYIPSDKVVEITLDLL